MERALLLHVLLSSRRTRKNKHTLCGRFVVPTTVAQRVETDTRGCGTDRKELGRKISDGIQTVEAGGFTSCWLGSGVYARPAQSYRFIFQMEVWAVRSILLKRMRLGAGQRLRWGCAEICPHATLRSLPHHDTPKIRLAVYGYDILPEYVSGHACIHAIDAMQSFMWH